MQITLVKDGTNLIAVEFVIEGEVYFVATDQSFWSGVRLGKYPRKSHDSDFEREAIMLLAKPEIRSLGPGWVSTHINSEGRASVLSWSGTADSVTSDEVIE